MAHWVNPTHRRIEGALWAFAGEGLAKDQAQAMAKRYRARGSKARVIRDDRLGRLKWCVYVR